MVGWFAEVFAASNDMVHVSRTVSPNPENHRVYQTGGHRGTQGPVLFDVNDFQRGLEDIGEYLQPDRGVRDGTAMTAAVMVGWFAEVFAASNDMVHVSRTVSPNPVRETWTMSFEAANTSANQPTMTAAVIAVPRVPCSPPGLPDQIPAL
jgi:hypothetical protein